MPFTKIPDHLFQSTWNIQIAEAHRFTAIHPGKIQRSVNITQRSQEATQAEIYQVHLLGVFLPQQRQNHLDRDQIYKDAGSGSGDVPALV